MVSRFRITVILLGVFAAFGYLIYNLYNIQVEKGSYYTARAESQYQLAGFLEPHRGIIYLTDKDQSLIPAALNKSYPVIFAVPKEIEDIPETANTLAPILKISETEIQNLLTNKKSLYRLLKKKANEAEVKSIEEAQLSGIYVDRQEIRFYPFASLAAHLLGFIAPTKDNDFSTGRYGLERNNEQALAGQPGTVKGDTITRPVQGKDLFLTIDHNIQERAEKILADMVKKYSAVGGLVVVENPQTGDILAAASQPTFDPNDYQNYPLSHFLNPLQQSLYEPGSIFKVITMASALDAGAVTPKTTYYDSGELRLDGRVIRNWDLKANGQQTMTEVIEKSLNTGSAYAAKKLGEGKFYDYIVKFGLTDKTNIQLPEEITGNFENLKKQRAINLATASFGQGISVTPIALINAVAAIANKGILPSLNLINNQKTPAGQRVIGEKAAQEITAMMASAVEKAKLAAIANYQIAGKTGTAQVPDFSKGGYTDDVINTYIGFGPVSKPRFVIMFKLDKPAGAPLAGQTVVPAFRELAEFILNYYNITPDNLTR